MVQRPKVHVVDPDRDARARLARAATAIGHHAESYATWDELAARLPREGVILARDMPGRGGQARANAALAQLGEAGIWLPLILVADELTAARVVEAMRRGARDYLELPCSAEALARAVARAAREAPARARAHRRKLGARRKLATLSRRERDVLDRLVDGRSNKQMARALGISPRTVEIHRANMMLKLGAGHIAHAVRLWFEANVETGVEPPIVDD